MPRLPLWGSLNSHEIESCIMQTIPLYDQYEQHCNSLKVLESYFLVKANALAPRRMSRELNPKSATPALCPVCRDA